MAKSESKINKTESKVVSVAHKSSAALAGNAFLTYHEEVSNIVERCERINKVGDDATNEQARQVAKEANKTVKSIDDARKALNKPLSDKVKSNNEDAKKIIKPLVEQVARLKSVIGTYEIKKEQARQERLRKAEEERMAREEKERKEREHIQQVRNGISKLNTDWSKKIAECKTSKTLDKYLIEIKGISITKKEYGDLRDEMKHTIELLTKQVDARRDIVIKIESASKDEKEEVLKEAAGEQAAVNQELTLEEQNREMMAEQDLITLVASLSTDASWNVQDRIKYLKDKYGSAYIAMQYRDDIIKDEQQHQQKEAEVRELKNDSVKNQRIELKFEVIDPLKVPREFLMVNEKKIREAVMANREGLKEDINSFTIDGIRIYKERQTVLK